jgi:hypothetical protein
VEAVRTGEQRAQELTRISRHLSQQTLLNNMHASRKEFTEENPGPTPPSSIQYFKFNRFLDEF